MLLLSIRRPFRRAIFFQTKALYDNITCKPPANLDKCSPKPLSSTCCIQPAHTIRSIWLIGVILTHIIRRRLCAKNWAIPTQLLCQVGTHRGRVPWTVSLNILDFNNIISCFHAYLQTVVAWSQDFPTSWGKLFDEGVEEKIKNIPRFSELPNWVSTNPQFSWIFQLITVFPDSGKRLGPLGGCSLPLPLPPSVTALLVLWIIPIKFLWSFYSLSLATKNGFTTRLPLVTPSLDVWRSVEKACSSRHFRCKALAPGPVGVLPDADKIGSTRGENYESLGWNVKYLATQLGALLCNTLVHIICTAYC